MKRWWLIILVALLSWTMLSLAPAARPLGPAPAGAGAAGGGGVRFVPVEVFVDSGDAPLAAYQVDLRIPSARILGLEGGEAAAFREAPYYDPAALHPVDGAAETDARIIVAAFSTDEPGLLPRGRTRVARLHLALQGGERLGVIESKLVVATDGAGRSIAAKLELVPKE